LASKDTVWTPNDPA